MTIRSRAQLLVDFADNTAGGITPANLRNLVDSLTLTAESGAIVRPSDQSLLSVATWTNANQVDMTMASEDNGRRLYVETPTGQGAFQARYKAKAGALAKITMAFWPFQSDGGNSFMGLYMRNAGTGVGVAYGIGSVNGTKGWYSARLNNAGVWLSDISNTGMNNFVGRFGPWYIKLEDDGTNRVFSWSGDEGAHWRTIHSIVRTDHSTFDQVGFGISSSGQTFRHAMSIIHISEA